MNKSEIVSAVSDLLEISRRNAEKAVDLVFNSIAEELKEGGKVTIAGFGSFEVRTRAARNGKHPITGEDIVIPEQKTPAFKAGKQLKDSVNGK